jgi:hypothetical protein
MADQQVKAREEDSKETPQQTEPANEAGTPSQFWIRQTLSKQKRIGECAGAGSGSMKQLDHGFIPSIRRLPLYVCSDSASGNQ